MELTGLKSQIMSKRLDKFYVFTGPESQVMRIYLNQMANVAQATITVLEDASELANKSRAKKFVYNRHIYILYDSKDFLSDEKLQAVVTSLNTFKDDIIVFIYSNIDKRSKLYKNMQDHIVTFDYLKPVVLSKYVKHDIGLNASNIEKLMAVCENDYSRILLEINKLQTYIMATNKREDEAFEILLKDGTIYQPPYDAVFDFVDAVLKRKKHLAFRLLEQSYACGEATMVLLSNLYNSAKQLLQVQCCNSDDITKSTGLTPFQVKLAKGRVNCYSARELIHIMRVTRNIEKGIKTGEIDESMAVYCLLISVWE